MGVTAAAVGGIAVITEAKEIADIALKTFNMAMFDEDLISDEFSNAIVRLYSLGGETVWLIFQRGAVGSAFIVRSEKTPDLYL